MRGITLHAMLINHIRELECHKAAASPAAFMLFPPYATIQPESATIFSSYQTDSNFLTQNVELIVHRRDPGQREGGEGEAGGTATSSGSQS